jgi:hypothetical protein
MKPFHSGAFYIGEYEDRYPHHSMMRITLMFCYVKHWTAALQPINQLTDISSRPELCPWRALSHSLTLALGEMTSLQ